MFEISVNSCRICLKPSSSKLRDIEEIHLENGSAFEVLTKMFQLTITQIELNSSGLPRKICTQCINHLEASVKFWNVVWTSQCRIEEWKADNHKETMKVFEELSSDEESSGFSETIPESMMMVETDEAVVEETIVEPDIEWYLQENDEGYVDDSASNAPKVSIHKLKLQLKRKDEEEILKLLIPEIIDENPKIAAGRNVKETKIYGCGVCHREFATIHGARRHIKQFHDKGGRLCKVEVTSHGKYWKYQFTVQPPNYRCKFCTVHFSNKEPLERHLVKKHKVRCALCDVNVHTKRNLKIHTREHDGLKIYKCPVCFRLFQHKSHLAFHAMYHNNF